MMRDPMPVREYRPNGDAKPWSPTQATLQPESVHAPSMLRNGHPRFYQLTREEDELHSIKNHDYASGGDPLGNFKRIATILALYPNLKLSSTVVIALVYALKQIDAALWILSQGMKTKVEGVPARLMDVSVYMKLANVLYQEEQADGKQQTLNL